MKTNGLLRIGDTVRATCPGSVHRHKVGMIESFTDNRHSARIRWLDGSTNTPFASSLTLVPPSFRSTPKGKTSAASTGKAQPKSRQNAPRPATGAAKAPAQKTNVGGIDFDQLLDQLSGIQRVLQQMCDLMAEDARKTTRPGSSQSRPPNQRSKVPTATIVPENDESGGAHINLNF